MRASLGTSFMSPYCRNNCVDHSGSVSRLNLWACSQALFVKSCLEFWGSYEVEH